VSGCRIYQLIECSVVFLDFINVLTSSHFQGNFSTEAPTLQNVVLRHYGVKTPYVLDNFRGVALFDVEVLRVVSAVAAGAEKLLALDGGGQPGASCCGGVDFLCPHSPATEMRQGRRVSWVVRRSSFTDGP